VNVTRPTDQTARCLQDDHIANADYTMARRHPLTRRVRNPEWIPTEDARAVATHQLTQHLQESNLFGVTKSARSSVQPTPDRLPQRADVLSMTVRTVAMTMHLPPVKQG
jgi:hypothetical protein